MDAATDYPKTGRSAVWVEDNVIGIREVPVPELGPRETLVRIRACGICGSDLHSFHAAGFGRHLSGIGPGHELAGEVVARGTDGMGPQPGTRVAVFAGRTCRECINCRSGRPQLCRTMRIAGGGYPGGMSEYFVAQSELLFGVPDSLSWPVAALSEPCAISLHAMKRANLRRGQHVLVLGAGAIGLFAALVAHDAGASVIGVTARYPHQAEAARALGATHIFDPDHIGRGSEAAGMDWDLVVETVGGSAPTIQQALDIVASGGTVLLLGIHTAPQPVSTLGLILREITVVGAFGYDLVGPRSDYDETLALLAKYQPLVEPLITHTYPLEEAAKAFETALDKRSGAIKVTVLP